MTREILADVLDEIALLLELKNENPFKVRAYRQGAESVRSFDGDIVQRRGQLRDQRFGADGQQWQLHVRAGGGESAATR